MLTASDLNLTAEQVKRLDSKLTKETSYNITGKWVDKDGVVHLTVDWYCFERKQGQRWIGQSHYVWENGTWKTL